MPTEEHELLRIVRQRLETENAKALSVAIIGQTGVGKSSLLNSLFGSKLAVGDVKPTTKAPEPVTVQGGSGHQITFWDMPGIGESEAADAGYMDVYREKMLECDVLLWAIHADSRSVTYDAQVLSSLFNSCESDRRPEIAQKLTFALTKADLLSPPPWIFAKGRRDGFFAPSPDLNVKLAEKSAYFEDVFARLYGEFTRSRTYNDCSFSSDDTRFDVTPHHVTFNGHMTANLRDALSELSPEFGGVFSRLRDNHRFVPCSAGYRYGLSDLLSVVVNKINVLATGRFQRIVGDVAKLERVDLATLRTLGRHIVVWDEKGERTLFDFSQTKL